MRKMMLSSNNSLKCDFRGQNTLKILKNSWEIFNLKAFIPLLSWPKLSQIATKNNANLTLRCRKKIKLYPVGRGLQVRKKFPTFLNLPLERGEINFINSNPDLTWKEEKNPPSLSFFKVSIALARWPCSTNINIKEETEAWRGESTYIL